uniref:Uncharacterized protein n=1 Tax=Lepeophtheirus salmonis TaxID=72036 RepID=A0A0K2TB22_LEPSM
MLFLSSDIFCGLCPWRPPLCKTHSMVEHTFVPAWSSVSIRVLDVVRWYLLIYWHNFPIHFLSQVFRNEFPMLM